MGNEKKYVSGVWAPAEYDLEGNCPYCNKTVFFDYNKNYCGNCGKKIYWSPEDLAALEEYMKTTNYRGNM